MSVQEINTYFTEDGKKVYNEDFLMAIKNMPQCNQKPDNIPKAIMKNEDKMKGSTENNEWAPDKEHGKKVYDNDDDNKGSTSQVNKVSKSVREDVKLHEAENAWKPARFNKSDNMSENDKKTAELYKKVRGVLNKLNPRNFDTLLSEIQSLKIDTADQLQGVVDLIFENAIDEPNLFMVYALMCKELTYMHVPGTSANNASINFRTLLITRCQIEFEKLSLDESEQNRKLKEIEECTDAERKKELEFDLAEYDGKLRMKSVGNIRFIGELFKQNMLSVSIMLRCLNNLLENKDEESLECVCVLLKTIGKELESKSIDLSPIFNVIKDIIDKEHEKVSNRVRFMLQDVIDLRKSKWVPRFQDVNPRTIEQIREEAKNEQLKIQAMKALPITPRKNDRGGNYSGGGGGGSGLGSNRINKALENIDFTHQHLQRLKLDKDPFSSEGLSLERASSKQNDGIDSRFGTHHLVLINHHFEEYLNEKMSVKKYAQILKVRVPLAYFPKIVADKCLHALKQSSKTRLRIGQLFDELISSGVLSIDDFCNGLEEFLSQTENLVNDFPMFWFYMAQILVYSVCDKVLPLRRLHKSMGLLNKEKFGAKMLAALLNFVISEQGPNYLKIIWQTAGLTFEDFMEKYQVEGFIKNNKFEFLVCDATPSAGQSQLTFDQIHTKLLEFFNVENWIIENVGDRTEENQFGRVLATAIFEHSIVRQKLQPKLLTSHYKLFHKFITNDPSFELECLFALQALFHKLEHPKGVLHSICYRLYQDSIISRDSFIAWETNNDPAEQEGKDEALKQLASFIKDNKFEFLVGGATSAGQTQLTFDQIHTKLLEFFNLKTQLDDVDNWITANVGDRTKENRFVRVLATAIFEHSIVRQKLQPEHLTSHYRLFHKFITSDPSFELQCLFALQALFHKMEHPQGVLLSICDRLYDDSIISQDSFIAWETNNDPAEQEGKDEALKQLASFFISLKETESEDSTSSSEENE